MSVVFRHNVDSSFSHSIHMKKDLGVVKVTQSLAMLPLTEGIRLPILPSIVTICIVSETEHHICYKSTNVTHPNQI